MLFEVGALLLFLLLLVSLLQLLYLFFVCLFLGRIRFRQLKPPRFCSSRLSTIGEIRGIRARRCEGKKGEGARFFFRRRCRKLDLKGKGVVGWAGRFRPAIKEEEHTVFFPESFTWQAKGG